MPNLLWQKAQAVPAGKMPWQLAFAMVIYKPIHAIGRILCQSIDLLIAPTHRLKKKGENQRFTNTACRRNMCAAASKPHPRHNGEIATPGEARKPKRSFAHHDTFQCVVLWSTARCSRFQAYGPVHATLVKPRVCHIMGHRDACWVTLN